MVLVPMKDARKRSLAQFLYCGPCRNRLKSQYSCCLVDTQHGNTFRCCKANLRQRVQRVLPAEISTNHLQAGDTTLHTVMLSNKFYPSHSTLFSKDIPIPHHCEEYFLNNSVKDISTEKHILSTVGIFLVASKKNSLERTSF